MSEKPGLTTASSGGAYFSSLKCGSVPVFRALQPIFATRPAITNDRPAFASGAVFWLLVCLAAVLIRGIRWEESFERAQLLINQVPYAPWHPFYRYAHSAFTIQYHLSAFLLWLIPSPALVCGIRQAIFLAATVLPPYYLAARASGRVLCGHIAANLTLSGVLVAFGSYYPLFVWPDKFTSGHIGMGCVLLALYLILSGRLRSGFFLTGLMPAIHIGQAPVLMVVAALYAVWTWFDAPGTRPRLIRAILWGAAGITVTAALWLGMHFSNNRLSTLAAGMTDAETLQAWKSYVFGEDIHRAFARFNPPAHGYIALGIALFLGLFAAADTPRPLQKLRDPATWLGIYAAITAAVVLSIAAAEHILGPNTPPALVVWMPNRLINHSAVIALALATAIPARKDKNGRVGEKPVLFLYAIALAWIALTPLSAKFLAEAFHARYIRAHEGVLFLLAGAAAAELYNRPRHKILYASALIAGTSAIGFYHQFGALLLVLGFALTALLTFAADPVRIKPAPVLAILCAITLAIALAAQWHTRATLPVNPSESAIRNYLHAHSQPGEFLLTPHWEIDWQEKTGRPVLYTYELPQYITYMPALAPDILQIRSDIYDIHLGLPWDYSLQAWKTRSKNQWEYLARKYRFRHVLSPKNVPLDLQKVLSTPSHDLYQIQ